jgi:hypothetical protein
MDFTDFVA